MARILILTILLTGCGGESFSGFGQGGAAGSAGAPATGGSGGTGSAGEAGGAGAAGASGAAGQPSIDGGMDAPPGCTISVQSAVFAGSCDKPTPLETVAERCDGLRRCEYEFQGAIDPGFDPAYGCLKDLIVKFECGDGIERQVTDEEAWSGDVLALECGCD